MSGNILTLKSIIGPKRSSFSDLKDRLVVAQEAGREWVVVVGVSWGTLRLEALLPNPNLQLVALCREQCICLNVAETNRGNTSGRCLVQLDIKTCGSS
jgi:hypothetical protein